jgi:hypothetical protein
MGGIKLLFSNLGYSEYFLQLALLIDKDVLNLTFTLYTNIIELDISNILNVKVFSFHPNNIQQ